VRGTVGLPTTITLDEEATATPYDLEVPLGAGEVTSLGGTASFRGAAPYLGIGWGSPAFGKKRLGFTLDVGVTWTSPRQCGDGGRTR